MTGKRKTYLWRRKRNKDNSEWMLGGFKVEFVASCARDPISSFPPVLSIFTFQSG